LNFVPEIANHEKWRKSVKPSEHRQTDIYPTKGIVPTDQSGSVVGISRFQCLFTASYMA
jgi:hypothetical protein